MVNLVIRDIFVEGKEDIENSSNGKQCNITIYIYVYQIFYEMSSIQYNHSICWLQLGQQCPNSHPYPFHNGQYCCAADREKVYAPQGTRCDGSAISIDSLCCENDSYIGCPHGICTSTGVYHFSLAPNLNIKVNEYQSIHFV